jgi:hypothetical protein
MQINYTMSKRESEKQSGQNRLHAGQAFELIVEDEGYQSLVLLMN